LLVAVLVHDDVKEPRERRDQQLSGNGRRAARDRFRFREARIDVVSRCATLFFTARINPADRRVLVRVRQIKRRAVPAESIGFPRVVGAAEVGRRLETDALLEQPHIL
jgi:hypothetical protein